MQEINLILSICERLLFHKQRVKTLHSSKNEAKDSTHVSINLEDEIDARFVQFSIVKEKESIKYLEINVLKFLNQGEEKILIKKYCESFTEEETLTLEEIEKVFIK